MWMTCALHVVALIKMTEIFEIETNKNYYYILFTEWNALHKPDL